MTGSSSTGRTMIPSPPYLLFAAAAKRQVSCLVCKKNLIEASFVGSNVVGVLDERLRKCAGSVITCFGRESQSQSERGLLLGGGEEIRGKQSAGEAHSSASVMSFTRNISKLKLGRKTNHSSGFNGSRLPRLPISRKYLT